MHLFFRRCSFLLLRILPAEVFSTKGGVSLQKPSSRPVTEPGIRSRGGKKKEIWVYSQSHPSVIEKQSVRNDLIE